MAVKRGERSGEPLRATVAVASAVLFPRRKIISMLRELGDKLPAEERRKLAKALDSWDANEAIGATWELAVLWATASTIGAKPHPIRVKNQKQPDGEIDLDLDRPVMFDVKSLSGDTFTFKERLDKATQKIEVLSSTIDPQFSGTIEVRYFEWSTSKYIPRQPATIDDPTQSKAFREQLKVFLLDKISEKVIIRIPSVITASFEKRKWKRPYFGWSCSIPDNLQKIKNNQSDYAIVRAREQLIPFRNSHYTGLILCDGGNSMFSDPRRYTGLGQTAADMFHHIVEESGIDFLFTVGCKDVPAPNSGSLIALTASSNNVSATSIEPFMRNGLPPKVQSAIVSEFKRALNQIPPTLRKPHSIKSIMEQDQRWQRRWTPRLGTSWSFRNGVTGMKLSARTLIDLLTGNISEADRSALLLGNMKETLSDGKRCIRDVRLESKGDDFDDDYIVIEFDDDPTRRSFSDIAKEKTSAGRKGSSSPQQDEK
ncbi:hypothetical protein [Mesorhizobium sp. BHbdii]